MFDGAQPSFMQSNKTSKHLQSFIAIPLLMATIPGGLFESFAVPTISDLQISYSNEISLDSLTLSKEDLALAKKIDAYYGQWDLPLTGYGKKIVVESKKHNVDPALPAAIFMRESTGGKFTCGDFNPGGFGGCTISFDDFDHAIEKIVAVLGGSPEEKSGHYYANKNLDQILVTYNSVIPSYSKEVKSIMKKIASMDS